MTNTLTLQGDIRTARTNDKTRILYPFRISRTSEETTQMTLNVPSVSSFDSADDTTYKEVNLGGISKARMILAFSDQPVYAIVGDKDNHASEETFVPFHDFFSTAVGNSTTDGIENFYLFNNSGSSANVTLFIVGSTTEN